MFGFPGYGTSPAPRTSQTAATTGARIALARIECVDGDAFKFFARLGCKVESSRDCWRVGVGTGAFVAVAPRLAGLLLPALLLTLLTSVCDAARLMDDPVVTCCVGAMSVTRKSRRRD